MFAQPASVPQITSLLSLIPISVTVSMTVSVAVVRVVVAAVRVVIAAVLVLSVAGTVGAIAVLLVPWFVCR
jgi:hypothetical protein